MGNTPPVADERIQKTQERMKLTKRDIGGFWKVFRKFDREREGTISMEVFFRDICKEERTLFVRYAPMCERLSIYVYIYFIVWVV